MNGDTSETNTEVQYPNVESSTRSTGSYLKRLAVGDRQRPFKTKGVYILFGILFLLNLSRMFIDPSLAPLTAGEIVGAMIGSVLVAAVLAVIFKFVYIQAVRLLNSLKLVFQKAVSAITN